MPESSRTICALSAPVTVFTDELMAELVPRHGPECTQILYRALLKAQERLLAQPSRNRKSDAYKAMLIAKNMAGRVSHISEDLRVLLGQKSALEVPMANATVEDHAPEEDFASLADDDPTFKEYESIFKTYPHVEVRSRKAPQGDLLVVGYCSGRGRNTSKIYRRNCVVVYPDGTKKGFKDLTSVIGTLKHTDVHDTRYIIKGIPLMPGMGVRYWTNYVGEGDVPNKYRYLFFTEDNVVQSFTAEAWEHDLASFQARRSQEDELDTPERLRFGG